MSKFLIFVPFFTEREISNGQSNESISSMDEGPVAPPRKVSVLRPIIGDFRDL